MKIHCRQHSSAGNDPVKNSGRILALYREAAEDGANLVVFPELALTGPDAGPLLLRRDYLDRCSSEIKKIAAATEDCGIILGTPLTDAEGRVYNCLVFAAGGAIRGCHQQLLLPFDAGCRDRRFFSPGSELSTIDFLDEKIGLLCGTDSRALPGWAESIRYRIDPAEILAKQGASILINCALFPFRPGREPDKRAIGTYHSARHNLPFLFCGYTGTHNGEIFDGASYSISRQAEEQHMRQFSQGWLVYDTEAPAKGAPPAGEGPEKLMEALVYGIRETAERGGWKDAAVISRGDAGDSLCLLLCRKALGEKRTRAVTPDSDFIRTNTLLIEGTSRTGLLKEGSRPSFAPLADLSCRDIRSLLTLQPDTADLKLYGEGAEDDILSMMLDNGLSPEVMLQQGYKTEDLKSLLELCRETEKKNIQEQFRLFFHNRTALPFPAE